MKITKIEASHLRIGALQAALFDSSYDDCAIVIHTDEGITGVGETESLPSAVQAIINGEDFPPSFIRARLGRVAGAKYQSEERS